MSNMAGYFIEIRNNAYKFDSLWRTRTLTGNFEQIFANIVRMGQEQRPTWGLCVWQTLEDYPKELVTSMASNIWIITPLILQASKNRKCSKRHFCILEEPNWKSKRRKTSMLAVLVKSKLNCFMFLEQIQFTNLALPQTRIWKSLWRMRMLIERTKVQAQDVAKISGKHRFFKWENWWDFKQRRGAVT